MATNIAELIRAHAGALVEIDGQMVREGVGGWGRDAARGYSAAIDEVLDLIENPHESGVES